MKFAYYKQEYSYTCGAAAARIALERLGIKRSEKQLSKILHTNKVRGTWHDEFPKLAERFKCNYAVKRNASIKDLKELLRQGFTLIVCYMAEPKVDHYAVVRSIQKKEITLLDPWYGSNHKMSLTKFQRCWKDLEKERRWLIAFQR